MPVKVEMRQGIQRGRIVDGRSRMKGQEGKKEERRAVSGMKELRGEKEGQRADNRMIDRIGEKEEQRVHSRVKGLIGAREDQRVDSRDSTVRRTTVLATMQTEQQLRPLPSLVCCAITRTDLISTFLQSPSRNHHHVHRFSHL